MAPFFSDVEEFTGEFAPLPVTVEEGAPPRNIYLCTIEAKYSVSKAGNNMVKVVSVVVEPEEFKDRRIFDNFMFDDTPWKGGGSSLGKTKHNLKNIFSEEFVEDLDGSLVDDIIPAIVSAINGLQVGVQVGQREEEYQGKKTTKNSVKNYFHAEEFGEEDSIE